MGFRYRKGFKIAPGLRLNLNAHSVSLTGGGRGAHVTYNSKGYRTISVGAPGTGLSYRTTRRVRGGAPRPYSLGAGAESRDEHHAPIQGDRGADLLERDRMRGPASTYGPLVAFLCRLGPWRRSAEGGALHPGLTSVHSRLDELLLLTDVSDGFGECREPFGDEYGRRVT